MFIGRFQPYYSFATTNNYSSFATAGYKRLNSGVGGEYLWQYCGQTGANRVIQCKEGRGKTDAQAKANARTHFCNTYGKNGQCYGDSGGIIPDPIKAVVPFGTAIPDKQTKQNIEHPAAYKPSSSTSRLPSVGGTPKSEKCGGCDSGDIKCELEKLSCEGTNYLKDWWDGMGESINKGTGGFGLLPILLLGGVILIVAIAKR
jgi:hypothetical protein